MDDVSISTNFTDPAGAVKSPVRRTTNRGTPSPARPRTQGDDELRGISKKNSGTAFGRKLPESSPVKRQSSKKNMSKEIEMKKKEEDPVHEETKNSETVEIKQEESKFTKNTNQQDPEEEEIDRTFEIHHLSFFELFSFIFNRTLTDIKFFFINSFNSIIAKDIEHSHDRRSQICANMIFVIWIVALFGLGIWMIRFFPNSSGYPIDRTHEKSK